jgi:glycogen debranching enzyme
MKRAELVDPYVLQGVASTTVEKIALKHGAAFLVTDPRGDLPDAEPEAGLYWRGTRFLRTSNISLTDKPLLALSHFIANEQGSCRIDLTNAPLQVNSEAISQNTIYVRRELKLRGKVLIETLAFTSFYQEPLTIALKLQFGADFADLLEVRGRTRKQRGELHPPQVSHDAVVLSYTGRDGITRETRLRFSPQPEQVEPQAVFWNLALPPDQPVEVQIAVAFHMDGGEASAGYEGEKDTDDTALLHENRPMIHTDNVSFNRLMTRSMYDLEMMCTWTPEGMYPYGGVPWYVCPFGRDALITSLEFLPWFPEVARGTLAFLAAHQGRKVDTFTEEEPGKILHEYRRGEMANCREIPFIPYYGTVDATPLFLITLAQYVRWTNDLAFLKQHWEHAQAAVRWMTAYGDADGDTFLEYRKVSEAGLVSQGWKDSWDAISHQDGRLAQPPIALCEVQGYAYAAYQAMEYLARRVGNEDIATQSYTAAEHIRASFLERFWWPEEQVFYLALDGEKQPCKVVSSNAGQCLWTGIIPEDWAHALVARLMRADMYTGWGIRTLSEGAARYNPMSYHNGSVWPHDVALIGAGFARYGHTNEAGRLLQNVTDISQHYRDARLPELICGFHRPEGYGPTHYSSACVPQSWAAGAPFLLLSALLGLQPEAEYERLTIKRPFLPDWMPVLQLQHLRLGAHRLPLSFERLPSGSGTGVILLGDTEIDVHVIP